MSKRFLITLITILVLGVLAGIAILLAKGYTLSSKERRIVGTGIITISSDPDAASVFVDGHLTTATNATISSLPPKSYTIRLLKEGFIPWERQVTVKEGLVTPLKVTLYPAIPTMYPLSFTGVANPVLSPDGSKLAYVVPGGEQSSRPSGTKKAGIWVWTMSKNQPISFARSSEPHQIAAGTTADFSKATLKWSPDSKQVLASVGQDNYLLGADNLNSDPRDITAILEGTLKGWNDDIKLKDDVRVASIKNVKFRKIASESAFLTWAPDETKFMSKNGSKDTRVYDLEEDKDYGVPAAKSILWLPDSRHLILVGDTTISVVDFDGTNEAVIYAGNFKDNFVFPWPDSSRLVIISSFPTPTASEPNLYGINLK